MTVSLYTHQADLDADIVRAWQTHRNVLAVLPTGGGKTVVFTHRLRLHAGASVAVAHRQELVLQMSLTLARNGVRHRIIAPDNAIKMIARQHVADLGLCYYDPSSRCAVAGVDTLLARRDQIASWAQQVTLVVMDEAHHVLRENKWGKAVELFPNARLLGVTAETERADGKGLGRHADGVFDVLVEGPSGRDLINAGYLTDYRIFVPPSDLDVTKVALSADGDFNRKQLATHTKQSHVTGDIVKHYLTLARGKLGVSFLPDVETATDTANKFKAAGVPAEVVTSKTEDRVRAEILRRFRRRELLQLVNVDLFGEGFDLPAIEVVSMGRASESWNLVKQQFGRALRIMEGKKEALIIDHVGNLVRHAARHGLPDARKLQTLDRRDKRGNAPRDPDIVPMRVCHQCSAYYPALHRCCPDCGHVNTPAQRSAPEFVDGNLVELDPSVLAALRGEVARVDAPASEVAARMRAAGAPEIAAAGAAKQHRARQAAQEVLRASMAWWAGFQEANGRTVEQSQVLFYHAFGIDVLSAQALGKPEAEALADRIDTHILKLRERLTA